MKYENNSRFASETDRDDALAAFRERFFIPLHNEREGLYFTGNSLGLQPRTAADHIKAELEDWARFGVEGHFNARTPWFSYHETVKAQLGMVVGAKPVEVAAMGSLSANLHFLLVSFYRPDRKRYKILCETRPFSSDQYILETQARFHGFDPDEAVVEMEPEAGEETLRTEAILEKIHELGDSLALVLFGGVNYITGQAFDMQRITEAAHQVGAVAGFDLAHAAGNIEMKLHDWQVDFAAWCSYKYLNSGPGGVAGVFVHEKFSKDASLPRFGGWWGYDEATRFKMQKGFIPTVGADGWQVSNAPVLPLAVHKASLDIFTEAGMDRLVTKSRHLTGYLEYILHEINRDAGGNKLKIVTPSDPAERGCQISFIVNGNGRSVFDKLQHEGVIADWREPDVIRMAPVPLYNSFQDVYRFGVLLKKLLA